jgi:hypothetical protein
VDVGFGDMFGSGSGGGGAIGDMAMQPPPMTPPMQQVTSTLYIQMVGFFTLVSLKDWEC